MEGSGFGGVFDTEVIDDEGEVGAVALVAEEACGGRLVVAVLGEVRNEAVLSEEAGLGEAIHTFVDLEEDVAVVDVGAKVVFSEGKVGQVLEGDTDVLSGVKGGAEVEVVDVKGTPVAVIRDDRVEQDFDERHGSSASCGGTIVITAIATVSAADAVGGGAVGGVFLFRLGVVIAGLTMVG